MKSFKELKGVIAENRYMVKFEKGGSMKLREYEASSAMAAESKAKVDAQRMGMTVASVRLKEVEKKTKDSPAMDEAHQEVSADVKFTASGKKVPAQRKHVEDEDDNGEIKEAVTVKKQDYSWGKMVTVHHGSENSYPLHPEHQSAIKKLKDDESTSFKDETNRKVTAHRQGETIHLSGAGSNKKTSVARSHFTESINEEMGTHRVSVTVTDPHHPATTMRNKKYEKRVKVKARDREHAIDSALHFYKKQGLKVHDHNYIGAVNESVKTTHENPLVTVHDMHGLHTHANLSTANHIFNTKVKYHDVHKGQVKTKSGRDDGRDLTFAISQHHAKSMKEGVETTHEFHLRQAAYHEKEGNTERAKYHRDQANDWRIKAAHDSSKRAERELAYKYGRRNEEVEQIDEISKELATNYLNKREPQHKPNMNSPETNNHDAKVAKGIRGAVSRAHGYGRDKNAENKVTGRFDYRKNVGATHTFNKEEVELDESMDKEETRLLQLARLGLVDKSNVSKLRMAMEQLKSDKPLSVVQRNLLLNVLEDLFSLVTGDDQVFMRLKRDVQKEEVQLEEGENKQMKGKDPCWKGYQMVGMKDKNGKKVPNCVPEETEVEEGYVSLAQQRAVWATRKDGGKGHPDNKKKTTKEETEPPFDGPYRKTSEPHKDQFGNTIKTKNVARHLARLALQKQQQKSKKPVS